MSLSIHAKKRIRSRDITMRHAQYIKGLEIAQSKGMVTALMIASNCFYIVNVKTGVVVTALKPKEVEFVTNIDGVVFV